jgi:hypothetical protein
MQHDCQIETLRSNRAQYSPVPLPAPQGAPFTSAISVLMAWGQHTGELQKGRTGTRDIAVALALPRAVPLDLHQVQGAVGRKYVAHIILLQAERMPRSEGYA